MDQAAEAKQTLKKINRTLGLLVQGKIRPRKARYESDGNHFTLEMRPGLEYLDGTPYDEDNPRKDDGCTS